MIEIFPEENCIFIGEDGMYHYFYKILNKSNDKYYYGIHTTKNLQDNYCGSGSQINREYKKFGKSNFVKYICKFFKNRTELLAYESEMVSENILSDPLCYNLIPGGITSNKLNTVAVRDVDGNIYMMDVNKFHKNSSIYKATTKDMIHIHKGNTNKLVYKKDIDSYLTDGWSVGQTYKCSLGKIAINNGSREIRIYPQDANEYLSNGWVAGGISRNKNKKSSAKGTVWITNGHENLRITKNNIEDYINQGWKVGTSQKTTKGYISITKNNINKNISPELLDSYIKNGWVVGRSANKSIKCTKIWINNGKSNKMILKTQDIPSGWNYGRYNKNKITPSLGKIAVTKDNISKMIFPSELESYILNGWVRGNSKTGGPKNKGKIRINNGTVNKMIFPSEFDTFVKSGWKKGSVKYNK